MTETVELMDGYEVRFVWAHSSDWFYTHILHNDEMVASKAVCKSHRRAVRWAKRKIRDHRRAIQALGQI
jgi:hypothetical protein